MESLKSRLESQAIALPKNENEKSATLQRREKILKFAEIYREICDQIFEIYRDTAIKQVIEVGHLRIYWVGGRIQDRPFTYNTDIDLIITFDKNGQDLIDDGEIYLDICTKIFEVFQKHGLNIFNHTEEVIFQTSVPGQGIKGFSTKYKPIFEALFLANIWNDSDYVKYQNNNEKTPFMKIFDRKIN